MALQANATLIFTLFRFLNLCLLTYGFILGMLGKVTVSMSSTQQWFQQHETKTHSFTRVT